MIATDSRGASGPESRLENNPTRIFSYIHCISSFNFICRIRSFVQNSAEQPRRWYVPVTNARREIRRGSREISWLTPMTFNSPIVRRRTREPREKSPRNHGHTWTVMRAGCAYVGCAGCVGARGPAPYYAYPRERELALRTRGTRSESEGPRIRDAERSRRERVAPRRAVK